MEKLQGMKKGGYTDTMIRVLFRHVREGIRNLSRNGWMTFASVSAVTVTLLLVGLFLLVGFNLQAASLSVENQVVMSVFLLDDAKRADIDTLQSQISSLPEVQSVVFVSKEQGLQTLRNKLKSDQDLLAGLDSNNPLPNKFTVKAIDPKQTEALANKIETFPYVSNVKYDKETFQKLLSWIGWARNISLVLMAALVLTAMFLISNTIRITIFARRREIEIMKLVGATNNFIRLPFLVEGFIMGLLGALLPIALLSAGYYGLVNRYLGGIPVALLQPMPVLTEMGILLLVVGSCIGMWGSVVSVRKFLRV